MKLTRNMIVETTDEFLSKLTNDKFNNIDFVNYLDQILKDKTSGILNPDLKRIGEPSGTGEAFLIENVDNGEEYVLKILKICTNEAIQKINENKRDTSIPNFHFCEMAMNGDIIYKIPYTISNKYLLIVPNYLTEPIIGIIVQNYTEKYTDGFMKIYAYNYRPENVNKEMYILSEKLDSIDNYITNYASMFHFLFSTVFSLNIAQKLLKYVHYDLHSGNIMARKNTDIKVYEVGDGTYYYTNFDFVPVIIDYGLNRLETDNIILNPKYRNTDIPYHHLDHYAYNPYYDIFTLLLTTHNKLELGYNKLDSQTRDHCKELLKNLFGLFINDDKIDSINLYLKTKLINEWRPNGTKLYQLLTDNDNLLTNAPKFLEKMCNYMKELIKKIENYEYVVNNITLESCLKKYGIAFSRTLIKNIKIKDINIYIQPNMLNEDIFYNYKYIEHDKSQEDDKLLSEFDNIKINSIRGGFPHDFRLEFKEFNRTRGKPIEFDIKNHYITTCYINQNEKNGYKFRFDCCRVDLLNYFQNNKIYGGVAINATFFNWYTDYKPLGIFKTKDLYTNEQLPIDFINDYGIIAINSLGNLVQDDYINFNKYEEVCAGGPVLIRNGNIVFDENKIIDKKNINEYGKFKYQCTYPDKKIDNSFKIENEKIIPMPGVRECPNTSGEFYHSGNQNPRTAIAFLPNNIVAFIIVEGRNSRGGGFDLDQLTKYCFNLGAINAINLDGGASSLMVWKNPNVNYISSSNPLATDHYPVGNIISYIKMK